MSLNPRQFSHRKEDTQRSAPPVKYAYASQDPPDPNKENFGPNTKTPPKSDY
jgi:hypothetical protein